MGDWKPEDFERCENIMLSKFERVYLKHRDSSAVEVSEKIKNQDVRKCNSLAAILRKKGNECLNKRIFKEAIYFYSKSLSCACFDSDEWSLALVNRSSALYLMKEYMDCLNDIECILNNNLNCDRKVQILIRKCKCYAKLAKQKALEIAITQLQTFILENNLNKKDFDIDEIWKLYEKSKEKNILQEDSDTGMNQLERYILETEQKFESNPMFLHASEAVKLWYLSKHNTPLLLSY